MARHFMLACRSPLRIVRSPATPRCFNFAGYRAASALTNQDCHQPAVVDGAEIATRGALDELEADNSIEAILARSRRKELVARAGPGAVRYLPSEDPNAFLLPDNRLEPAERKWQKLFVALPWLTFAAMLALPTLLVHGNLPYLLQRAEHEKQAVGRRVALADRVADFQVVNFGQMPDVLERPFPTMLILFHPATFASKVFVPALRDLEGLLRKAEIPVSIAALDLTASPAPPDAFLWEYPAAVAPHIQLILPRSMDGEAGVVDYDGVWDARSLAMAACRLAGPRAPEISAEEISRLENGIQKLRDLIFEMLFLQEVPLQDVGRKAWWSRWLHRVPQQDRSAFAVAEKKRWQAVYQAEQEIEILHGLEAAISSCEAALLRLQRGPSSTPDTGKA